MLKTWFEKALAMVRSPSGLTGACLGLTVASMEGDAARRVGGAVFGWLYGTLVGWIIRWFRVTPGMYPVVGLLAGPVPFAFLSADMPKEDRGGAWLATAVLGFLIGCVEWGHRRREQVSGQGSCGRLEGPRVP